MLSLLQIIDVGRVGRLAAGSAAAFAIATALTYIVTYVRYHVLLSRQLSAANALSRACDTKKSKRKNAAGRPTYLPYAVPFLGSALSFLSTVPGHFWELLKTSHPMQTGAVRMLLGGKTQVLLFSPTAASALFRSRQGLRVAFGLQITQRCLGMSEKEARCFQNVDEYDPDLISEDVVDMALKYGTETELMHDFMLKADRVNELTADFLRVMEATLDNEEALLNKDGLETEIWPFMRRILFKSTITSFLGSRLLEMNPTFEEEYYAFDKDMVKLYFGLPKLIIPKTFEVRDTMVSKLANWHETMMDELNGVPDDPEEIRWEPRYGSRANRARQYLYYRKGLSFSGRASVDLGFIFAMASNVIPATVWMLMHILSDEKLRAELMEELKAATNEDGSFDIPLLVNLPLLMSLYYEINRFYSDSLVQRELIADITLPLDDGKSQIALRKGDVVIIPAYLSHRAEGHWPGAPTSEFDPRRFLVTDPDTGKRTFCTTGHTGLHMPFGGGKYLCPGRTFAKQEMLITVASMLTRYDIKNLGFTTKDGLPTDQFPPLAPTLPGVPTFNLGGGMKLCIKKKESAL